VRPGTMRRAAVDSAAARPGRGRCPTTISMNSELRRIETTVDYYFLLFTGVTPGFPFTTIDHCSRNHSPLFTSVFTFIW
jgi:hypothetical protein